jgi:acyl dehydratase
MPFNFSDLNEGDALPDEQRTPSTEQVVNFCNATGNAGPQFLDANFAKERMGLPGPIIPGNMKQGFLDQYLRRQFGSNLITRLQINHRRPDLHNAEMTIGGEVTKLREEDGRRFADLEIHIDNPQGDRSVRGAATIAFD